MNSLTKPRPIHLLPTSCYICGAAKPHADGTTNGGHKFWSNADADEHFAREAWRRTDGRTWADGVFAEERPWPEVGA